MEKLKHDQAISINVWGRKVEVKINSVRVSYDEPEDDTLDDKEMELLNDVLDKHLVEATNVKEEVLDYINGVYESIGEPTTEDIMPPEVVITTLVVDEEQGVVAFCGECQCDEEHGISISFVDGKFACVGEFMDYEFARDSVE